jgi:predicted kinase
LVLRIERTEGAGSVLVVLSGHIELQYLSQLERILAGENPVVLDFKEVRRVDRAAIETLARWNADGVNFENCPAYLRDWIAKLQSQK